MTQLTVGYSEEDIYYVQQLEEALQGRVVFHHLMAGRENEAKGISHELSNTAQGLLLVVSQYFLTNPNCMLGTQSILRPGQRVFPVALAEDLGSRSAQMRYISHWQDRYIELRRGAEVYDQSGKEDFDRYLAKIRETSIGVTEVLERLNALGLTSPEKLAENDYESLVRFADRPGDLRRPANREITPTTHISPLMNETINPPAETADERVQRAWELSDQGRTAEALEVLHQGRERCPDGIDLHYQYALMLALAADRTQAARTELNALLDRDPLHHDGLYLSGELHAGNADHVGARSDWERLSDLQPFYPDLNQRLGMLLADHFPDHYIEANTFLQRAVRHEDVSADVLFRYAQLLLGPLGRKKKARKLLDKTIAADPNHAPAHYQLAVIQFHDGKHEQARKNFLLAVALESTYDTPANREAFYGSRDVASALPVAGPASTPSVPELTDPLTALKRNLADLEAVLSARAAPAPASPPKPGKGKTVLISGATSGIGLATARRLAVDGYRLILLGRRKERLEEISKELRDKHGIETHLLILDVRERAGVRQAIEGLPASWKSIDVLLNNAGKAKGFDPIQEGNLDHWDEMIDVNLKGLLYLTRAVTPSMVARGTGMVINVASTAGKEVYPNGNVYCATKHAVDALTYAMRLDLVKHGVRVGQVCPAHVEETEFALVRFDGDAERARIYQDFQPLRSRDVAEAIHFMIDQPLHVNILDMVLQGTQQASSTVVDRSGRGKYAPQEEE